MFPDSATSPSPSPHLLCSNYLEYISWVHKYVYPFLPQYLCSGCSFNVEGVIPTLSPTGKILQDADQMSLPHVILPLVTPEEITATFSQLL